MSASRAMIGRAGTVLVFQGDAAHRAVISMVVARVRRDGRRQGVRTRGPAQFEPQVLKHVETVLIPWVDRLLELLHIRRRPRAFELAVVNLGAAAAANVGLTIDGYSADAAILLAMLSAALRMPLPQDLVATGHVASTDGDVRMVSDLPAKLDAASRHDQIRRFICPAATGDDSLRTLSPQAADAVEAAVAQAKSRIRVMEIVDLCELLQATWSAGDIVTASLRRGFFHLPAGSAAGGAILERAAAHLGLGNEARFWGFLQSHLQEGRSGAASQLLAEYLRFHTAHKKYPARGGRRLLALLRSVPPATRRLKLAFPLVSIDVCLAVGRFASPNDHEDVQHLMDAVLGRLPASIRPLESPGATSPAHDATAAAVQAVLSEISREALARKIGLPIDAVRAAYVLDQVVTDSYDVFCDTVGSFYRTLVGHTGAGPAPAEDETIAAEAFELLEQAFARDGGVAGAWAEARDITRGGLRYVLDLMTERYKAEQQSKHVTRVVKVAVDPLDWSNRVAFMRELMTRLGPHLPPELRSLPPERLARQHETICQLYVRSFDRVKDLLRTL